MDDNLWIRFSQCFNFSLHVKDSMVRISLGFLARGQD
jgi:hypothetical protein